MRCETRIKHVLLVTAFSCHLAIVVDLSRAFSVLHAVKQFAINISDLAETRAKSPLVKSYANAMSTNNAKSDAKLLLLAKKNSIDIVALDPQTEAGKSLIERMKAEGVLLASLDGDAFDKEYMTLVTNTQLPALAWGVGYCFIKSENFLWEGERGQSRYLPIEFA